jgi:outer membrane murein-binding lipoprotein Lpp
MHRNRRLVVVAVLGLLGGLALGGCRSQPGVAAYVGSHRYTVDEVSAYTRELKASFDDFSQANGAIQHDVVYLLVVRDLGARIAQERHFAIPAADPTRAAEYFKLPADSRLARLAAEFNATVQALSGELQPVEPTEADQREVYAHLLVNGQRADLPFEQVRPLLTQDVVGSQLALRAVLAEAAARYHVTINPRYGPPSYTIDVLVAATRGLTMTSSLTVPFGQPGGPPVVNRP